MTEELVINKTRTALVVIDLQKGIASNPALRPHSSEEVIMNATKLANVFRKSSMPVFLVHVIGTKETALKVISDVTFSRPASPSPDWTEFVPELTPTASDVVITKRQWGAFYGTELDLQLRRRGIRYYRSVRGVDRLWCREHGKIRLRVRLSANIRGGCHGLDVR